MYHGAKTYLSDGFPETNTSWDLKFVPDGFWFLLTRRPGPGPAKTNISEAPGRRLIMTDFGNH